MRVKQQTAAAKPSIKLLRVFAEDKEGATAIEYGLIVALLAMAVVGSLTSTTGSMKDAWAHIAGSVETAIDGSP